MDQVFCDRCKKEIQRGDDGTLNYFKLEFSRVKLGKHGNVTAAPATEIKPDLCGDCKDEIDKSLAAAV